jgi:threonine dehydrogenase-like Zn-dependent dehydrogenase
MTPATRRDIPGDSIDGYARDYVCMPAHAFTKAPAGYTHVEAATLPCAAVTAWRGLVVCGRVKLGDTVLILGTGGVSLFALQFAKAAGARVIATSSSDEKFGKTEAPGGRCRHKLQGRAELEPEGKGFDRRARGRSRHRGRWTRNADAVNCSLPYGRTYRLDRRLDRVYRRTGDSSAVFQSDPDQRDLDRLQSRSRGHDSSHNGESPKANYRPSVSTAGHCSCV